MSQEEANKLGELLKAKREAGGLSLRALAAAAEVDFTYIAHIERGAKRQPSPEILARLAGVLDLDTEELGALAALSLPRLAPYLRAKYDLPPDAVDELERHFDAVAAQYGITPPVPKRKRTTKQRGRP